MVLLTMTPGIVRALARAEEASPDAFAKLQRPKEPTLADPKPGNPISHSQLIDLSKLLKKLPDESSPPEQNTQDNKANDDPIANDPSSTCTSTHTPDPSSPTDTIPTPKTLSSLLAHTKIYTPPPTPPPPKPPQYNALMARLRAAEEARSYEKMLHPPPTRESFTQRFPTAPIFAEHHPTPADSEDDDLTYDEVHRQIILIINILISIVCVACFIWVAARHWSVGKRLGLSLGGSLGVAVAEVAVYGGYVRKVKEAKARERKKPEIKEIVRSWVLDKGEDKESAVDEGVRKRKGRHR